MKTVHITQFNGGMANDTREPAANMGAVMEHFDAFTNQYKLTPYRSSEVGDGLASTNQIANYQYISGILYGYGVVDNGSGVKEPGLFKFTDTTTSTWTADSHSTSPTGSIGSTASRANVETPLFIYYPNTGKIYGGRDLQYIWSCTPGTTENVTEVDLTSYAFLSNGLVHSKQDILYIGYDNKIASNNAGSWTAAVLTLPANFVITQLVEYGNYIAIGCRNKYRGRSKVFLWDGNSSLTNIPESIDWGDGELFVLEEIDGYLVGVSFEYATTGTTLDSQMMLKTRVAFRYYDGARVTKFNEFVGSSTSPAIASSFSLARQKVNNKLYFCACIPINTTGYEGVWSIGRSSSNVPFAVTLDRLLSTSTSIGLYGFILLGDYMFISYTSNSTFGMDKTDHIANYTTTSLYESTINPGMSPGDRMLKKKLLAAALSTEPLTSGQQAILKYRVDGGAWTTIFTDSVAGTVVQEKRNASAAEFTSGREYEFHVESTGGAEITGIHYKYEVVSTLL